MKKLLISFLGFVLIFQIFIGCTQNRNVEFKEFNCEIMSFDENDDESKPIAQDAILMMNNDEYEQFKDKYFTPREIRIESPNKEKAVLYLQFPVEPNCIISYKVQSINVKNNTLTVNLKSSTGGQVDPREGFNGIWKWIMFVEIDKTNLKDNMKIVTNIN